MRDFMKLIQACWDEGKFLCVGLDTNHQKIPSWFLSDRDAGERVFEYNKRLIEATKGLVCAYKLNSAFYEALGQQGIVALRATCRYVHEHAPGVSIILDAKRGDIGSTNEGYVQFLFEYLDADATTVHPYLGEEALEPFLKLPGKGIFVLCRTSNPGAGEFQDLSVVEQSGGKRMTSHADLWRHMADRVGEWNQRSLATCGLVAGATYPQELKRIREAAPVLPILVPGVGAQGGDAEAAVKAAADEHGQGFMVNSSRAIIFASEDEDFDEVATRKASELSLELDRYRQVPA